MAEQRTSLVTTSSVTFYPDSQRRERYTLDCRSGVHGFAGSIPARPPQKHTSMGPDLVIRACAVSQGFALPHNFVEC